MKTFKRAVVGETVLELDERRLESHVVYHEMTEREGGKSRASQLVGISA